MNKMALGVGLFLLSITPVILRELEVKGKRQLKAEIYEAAMEGDVMKVTRILQFCPSLLNEVDIFML
jgi:hypothetical protein